MTEKNRIEHLRGSRELAVDELEHVSGGAPAKARNNCRSTSSLLTEVFISSVSLALNQWAWPEPRC
jgi:hypothetical protein